MDHRFWHPARKEFFTPPCEDVPTKPVEMQRFGLWQAFYDADGVVAHRHVESGEITYLYGPETFPGWKVEWSTDRQSWSWRC